MYAVGTARTLQEKHERKSEEKAVRESVDGLKTCKRTREGDCKLTST